MQTVIHLLEFARHQARIEARDYFDPRYPRPDEIRAWRNDRGHRDRDRRLVFQRWGFVNTASQLVPGRYGSAGRLEITAEGIDYTACQYPAREIWPAVFDYFERVYALEG
jgi:hypothetical protein